MLLFDRLMRAVVTVVSVWWCETDQLREMILTTKQWSEATQLSILDIISTHRWPMLRDHHLVQLPRSDTLCCLMSQWELISTTLSDSAWLQLVLIIRSLISFFQTSCHSKIFQSTVGKKYFTRSTTQILSLFSWSVTCWQVRSPPDQSCSSPPASAVRHILSPPSVSTSPRVHTTSGLWRRMRANRSWILCNKIEKFKLFKNFYDDQLC